MTSAPPPYPGVDPNMAPYPPPQANGMNGYAQGNSNGKSVVISSNYMVKAYYTRSNQ